MSHKPPLISPQGLWFGGKVLKYFLAIFLSLTVLVVAVLILFYYQATPLSYSNPFRIVIDAASARLFLAALAITLIPGAVGSWFLAHIIGRHELLKDQMEFNVQLFSAATDSVMVHELNGKCIYANDEACRCHGYEEEELVRINFYELNAPEYVNTVEAKIEELMKKGRLTFESTHIRKDNSLMPVEVKSRIIKAGGRKLILSVIHDITERRRTEEELRQSSERLQRAIEGTINAVALTTEFRDPYTAGHQHRVAKLACVIARELGLTEEQIEGVRVAGTLHDIGKIYVPAEILSRPGRLRKNEINLVRDHAQVGYDLLNKIEFPWPVAQIVFQHHERMDGSGYPLGISGGEILVEARIMGVADVVEAMASHRPYRPALSVEEALLEILQQKGVLYYPEVVDACISLFTKKGFTFE
ncbi:MAG: PAS domain S-box protein [Dehalococcoidia bacterium]|nr:PAS domain S-box protein [Dehalococcoidia bacterium]